jgi:hypothetical protein
MVDRQMLAPVESSRRERACELGLLAGYHADMPANSFGPRTLTVASVCLLFASATGCCLLRSADLSATARTSPARRELEVIFTNQGCFTKGYDPCGLSLARKESGTWTTVVSVKDDPCPPENGLCCHYCDRPSPNDDLEDKEDQPLPAGGTASCSWSLPPIRAGEYQLVMNRRDGSRATSRSFVITGPH